MTALDGVQLRHQVRVQIARFLETALAEIQPDDGATRGPVPAFVHGKAPKQRLIAFKELLQRIDQKTLAEATRT